MAEWSRDNPWRQGHIIPHAVACGMGLVADGDEGKRLAIVVTHDCDIAQGIGAEPELEVIVGNVADRVEGSLTAAKNPRRLHLPMLVDGNEIHLELRAIDKARCPKSNFVGHAPRADIALSPSGLATLQIWLASRYRRGAFPDVFDARFKSTKVCDKIISILKGTGNHIEAVFFDIDDGQDVARTEPADTYTLAIYVVYGTGVDPEAALAVAEGACGRIEEACRAKWFTKGVGWREIELRECMPIADVAFSFRDSQILKRWNVDYMSLSDEAWAK